jgi:hypothetical protein
MPYYAPSVFYPVVGANHAKVFRAAAKLVRQPIALLGEEQVFDFSESGPFADQHFPKGTSVLLLSDREHVLTVNTSEATAQFSQNYLDVAVHCAADGWLRVKV